MTLVLAPLARSAAPVTDRVTPPTPLDCAPAVGSDCEVLVDDATLQAMDPSRRVGCSVQAGR